VGVWDASSIVVEVVGTQEVLCGGVGCVQTRHLMVVDVFSIIYDGVSVASFG
jgi:hypothetical protein